MLNLLNTDQSWIQPCITSERPLFIYIGSFLKTQKCVYRIAFAVIPLTYMRTKLNKQTKTFGKKRTPCFIYWSHIIKDPRCRIFELETKNSFVFHEQQIQLFLMKNLNLQQLSGIRNLLSSCYVTDTRYYKQYQKQPMISRILYAKEDYREVNQKTSVQ